MGFFTHQTRGDLRLGGEVGRGGVGRGQRLQARPRARGHLLTRGGGGAEVLSHLAKSLAWPLVAHITEGACGRQFTQQAAAVANQLLGFVPGMLQCQSIQFIQIAAPVVWEAQSSGLQLA